MSLDRCAESEGIETVGPEADWAAAATCSKGDLLEESVKELVLPLRFLEVVQLRPGTGKLIIKKPVFQVGQRSLPEFGGNCHVLKGDPGFLRQVSHCCFS